MENREMVHIIFYMQECGYEEECSTDGSGNL